MKWPRGREQKKWRRERRLREINQKPDISFTKKRGHFLCRKYGVISNVG
jgi:hypothetical protein